MNDPQENSPVVSAPTTRSGGGSRVLMSATCDATSVCRKLRTCRSRSEASICVDVTGVSANKLQLGKSSPQRIMKTGGVTSNLFCCGSECSLEPRGRPDEPTSLMASPGWRNSPGACAVPATAGPPASSIVRRSTSHHWDACYIRGEVPQAAYDPCLRRESNTHQSAIARCVPPHPDSFWSERSPS